MSQSFRVSRIRKKRIRQSKAYLIAKDLPWGKMLAFGTAIFIVTWGITFAVSKISLGSIFSFLSGIVAEELKMDTEGRTNILVLGTGGEGHQGRDLTDSIMLVSYFHPENTVTMVSVPRDLYIKTDRFGGTRINGILELAETKEIPADDKRNLEYMRYEFEKIFAMQIQYYVKLDFKALEKVVDELGGVDVHVEKTIDDPFYPDDKSYGYKPFRIEAGDQHLDGETALKYARSRETSSDFSRAARQQQVLKAMKDKAKASDILGSPSRISRIYDAVSDHVVTDFEIREMVMLARLGKDLEENHIYSYVIHDDPTKTGGFLFTPLRELFGGAFVLIPASNDWAHIRKFLQLVSINGSSLHEDTGIQILNGTKKSGAAAETKMILKRYGFNVLRFGNGQSQDIAETTLYYKSVEPPRILDAIKFIIPGKISTQIPQKYLEPPYESDALVIIELGADYLPVFNALDIFRNVVPLNPPTPEGTPETSTESSPDSTEIPEAEESASSTEAPPAIL